MDRKQGRWKRVLFLDDNTGYRLLVADAAAGSRFYELEMTKDGGQSWNQKNADPFDGNIGVAEGIEFYNEIWALSDWLERQVIIPHFI